MLVLGPNVLSPWQCDPGFQHAVLSAMVMALYPCPRAHLLAELAFYFKVCGRLPDAVSVLHGTR